MRGTSRRVAALAAAIVVVLAGLIVAAPHATRAAASTPNPVGIYAGPSNVSTVNTVNSSVNGSIHYVMDFLDPSSWTNLVQPSWFLNNWDPTGYSMIWAIPILPDNGCCSLAIGATGAYNQYFASVAQQLVNAGQGSSIIRLGWEQNGSWFPWTAMNDPTSFINYWRQIVTTMRNVPGGHFRFEWNPTIGSQSIPADQTWPGAQYVDIIGLDIYDANWPALQPPEQQWQTFLTEPYGLDWLASFGAQMGKPLALPEWGLWNDGSPSGSGDNPTFIDQMMGWIASHNVVHADYWDYGTSAFSVNPLAYAAYKLDMSSLTASPAGTQTTVVTTTTQPAPTMTSVAPTNPTSTTGPGRGVHGASVTAQPYWTVGSDGGVFSFGGAAFYGSTGGIRLNKPVVTMAATPDGRGYWLVASDGGVFSFGDAGFYGSTGGVRLTQPIVGMTPTSDGKGYWLVAADGGLFAFGDPRFHGSAAGLHLSRPVVGMSATPDGNGYWMVAADGGIMSFGDAAFRGSAAGGAFSPAVGMADTPDGGGYWVVRADGSVQAFGDAGSYGSGLGTTGGRAVAIIAAADGKGYALASAAGGVRGFGSDTDLGPGLVGVALAQPVVAMASA